MISVISVAKILTSERVTEFDVLIVGGGPAGSSAAIRLASKGARVLLVEREKFPRAKLCGEFISPECLGQFEQLGVAERMRAAGGSGVRDTVFYARGGRGVAVPSAWFGGAGGGAALGLSRAEMDERLLARAREVGVEVLEEAEVVGVLTGDGGRVAGVRVRTGGGGDVGDSNVGGVRRKEREFRALVTIDATGRARVVARCAEREIKNRDAGSKKSLSSGTKRTARKRATLVAFKAHVEGARGGDGVCEIYFYRGGYGGLSPVEGGRSNLCFIASAQDVRALGGDAGRVVREVLMENARARVALEGARVCSAWLSVALESFGRRELVPREGLIAAGDAASFIDPFTGSGMLMALENGELVAEAISRRLPRLREACVAGEMGGSDIFAALAGEYETLYEEKFGARLRVCSWLRRAAFAPSFVSESVVGALGASGRVRRAVARATRHTA